MGFGRFECLQIRNGELVLDPWPKSVRDVKFGGQGSPQTGVNADDFVLKQEVTQLFEYIRSLNVGEIQTLEIRHGLPFSMEIALNGSVNPECARQSPAHTFGPQA
jgi:hypothetical protein